MLQVNTQLAEIIGINESIILQQIQFWINRKSGQVIDGVRWIYNRLKDWQEQFPWLSLWDVRKVFKRLRHDLKLLKFEQFESKQWYQRGWYTINYEAVKALSLSNCAFTTFRDVGIPHNEVSTARTSSIETKLTPKIKTTTDTPAVEEVKNVLEEAFPDPDPLPPEEQELESIPEQLDPGEDDSSSVDALSEIRALPVAIALNQNVRKTVKAANQGQVMRAIAYVREAIKNWRVKPDFNWTGLLVKAIREGLEIEVTPSIQQAKYDPPSLSLESVKAMYGANWEEAAAHFGLIND